MHRSRIFGAAAAALLAVVFFAHLRAEDALFFGNSFTMGVGAQSVFHHGGVPALVQAIAQSRGKNLTATMEAVGGKDLAFHLARPETATALTAKKWDWVVLQDYSTRATHAGSLEDHIKDVLAFRNRIVAVDPDAKIILYETWAYAKANPIFSATPSPKTFIDPAQMLGEVRKGYAESCARVKAAGATVAVAHVGTAFARCVAEHPEIGLYSNDQKHPSAEGSYLAALVIYDTIFGDKSAGATRQFPAVTLSEAEANALQQIADSVSNPKAP
jgi:hypothetical protein